MHLFDPSNLKQFIANFVFTDSGKGLNDDDGDDVDDAKRFFHSRFQNDKECSMGLCCSCVEERVELLPYLPISLPTN